MKEDFAELGQQDQANPRHLLPQSMLCRCMRAFKARSRAGAGQNRHSCDSGRDVG